MRPDDARVEERETTGSSTSNTREPRLERYHDDADDADESNDSASSSRRARGSQTPSVEFDGLMTSGRREWRDRIIYSIPRPLRKAWRVTKTWVKGPRPPRIYSITPFFPKMQHAPIRLLDKLAPKREQRFWLLIAVYLSWLLAFSLILWKSSFSAQIPGYGSPTRLSCSARYWSEGDGCGLNGDECRPFSNSTLAFRCPAECLKTQLLNPHAVGDQEVNYKPLVVGGPQHNDTGLGDLLHEDAVYRSDSFICASAIHSGFIADSQGGCGVLTLTGEQPSFTSSDHHSIVSTGFDSYFPHSFGFLSGTRAACADLRWPALGITVFFTTLLSLFTTDPGVHFWSIFISLFFHVALASDPPTSRDYYGLVSSAFGRFLPAAFCSYVVYRFAIRRTLTDLTAQIEKTVFWLGAAWVGALNNYTFDKIPISRLTPHDIQAQPGAVPALIAIVGAILAIALGQAWAFRVEGRMPRYLALYCTFVVCLLIMFAIPGLSLRIHHYILALIFLPGTSFQNRPSLIYQGLLIGLFINGTARWGFDSILQTPTELLAGMQQGSLLPNVTVLDAASFAATNISFAFAPLPVWDPDLEVAFDGLSVLVNDVERFRGYADDAWSWSNETAAREGVWTWTWERHLFVERGSDENRGEVGEGEVLPEYFRFAYLAGSETADYTKAGVWDAEGVWHEMEDGPS